MARQRRHSVAPRPAIAWDGPAGQVVEANPQLVLSGEPPILIDEWQRVPATWDAVRRADDDRAPPNTYLLAGSASERGAHSGAGAHPFAQRIGDDLVDSVVVTTGPYVYRRPDGIAVVPAALLGP